MTTDRFMKQINNYIQDYFKDKTNIKSGTDIYDWIEPEQKEAPSPLMKRIICKDGFSMSVQGGKYMYCNPRETLFFTHSFLYDKLEVLFPSKKEPLLMEWCDNPKKPKEAVYAYVPVGVINEVIEKHGGIK